MAQRGGGTTNTRAPPSVGGAHTHVPAGTRGTCYRYGLVLVCLFPRAGATPKRTPAVQPILLVLLALFTLLTLAINGNQWRQTHLQQPGSKEHEAVTTDNFQGQEGFTGNFMKKEYAHKKRFGIVSILLVLLSLC